MDDAWQTDMAPPADERMRSRSPQARREDRGGGERRGERAWEGDRDRPRRDYDRPERGRAGGGGRRDEGENNPGNNLHVTGLSRTVDTAGLEAAFTAIGRVQRANIVLDPHTRESRGFGFVMMETGEEADAAIAALNGTEIGGRVVVIEKARRGRARTPTPGKYYGPPKRREDGGSSSGGYERERQYDPRPYDSRYSRGGGGGGGRDYDRGGRDYDRYDRAPRGGGGGGREYGGRDGGRREGGGRDGGGRDYDRRA